MVVNGLGGYWQWNSHNGGEFSITSALKHLDLLTTEETIDPHKFNRYKTNQQCHYFMVKPIFLARLVKKFELPTTNLEIGGKANLTEREFRERDYMKKQCPTGGLGSQGLPRYEQGLKIM